MARASTKWGRKALRGYSEKLWGIEKLAARWIVFTDRAGNLVIVDLEYERPLGIDDEMVRPPMICIAATRGEYAEALERFLEGFERLAKSDAPSRSLSERVSEQLSKYRREAGDESERLQH
jgi:hypothetical protein